MKIGEERPFMAALSGDYLMRRALARLALKGNVVLPSNAALKAPLFRMA
jgi:hypothetical protein